MEFDLMGRYASAFLNRLHAATMARGGICNAHLHIDRAGTINPRYAAGAAADPLASSHAPLAVKHSLIPMLHAGPAYEQDDLKRRVDLCLDAMVEAGTTSAATFVDVTADRVGLQALETLADFSRERRAVLDFRVGAYSPLGFRDDEPERWELLERGARRACFIGSLPERDDVARYPEHIGFTENCRRMLALGQELGKAVHLHADQRNDPAEAGTERILDVIRELDVRPFGPARPAVWLIHVISPSTYDEPRFAELLAQLVECRVGVICCPSAALSMLQLRPRQTPTSNSIARVLDFLAAGIDVRVGCDNIADYCSPAGTPDLMDEMFVLANALRFYHIDILAKIAAGVSLSRSDRRYLQEHLEQNGQAVEQALREYPIDDGSDLR